MNEETETPKERILNTRLKFEQNDFARKEFTALIDKNEHGSFTIQSSHNYHEMEFYKFNGVDPTMLLSRSMLKSIDENPEQWAAGKKFKRNKKMDMGSLLDAAMLETRALNEFVFLPDGIRNFQTKAAQELRDDAYAERKMPILYADLEVLLGTLLKTTMSESCKDMLRGATSCVSMVGMLENTPIKGLLDIVPAMDGKFGDGLCDLKRTKAFLPDKFRRIVFQLKYHWQAAIYLDLWNNWCEVMGMPERRRHKWYFLIVQEDYPFGVGVAQLDPIHVEEGREQYRRAIKRANLCLSSGVFPNPYEIDGRVTIGFPPKS